MLVLAMPSKVVLPVDRFAVLAAGLYCACPVILAVFVCGLEVAFQAVVTRKVVLAQLALYQRGSTALRSWQGSRHICIGLGFLPRVNEIKYRGVWDGDAIEGAVARGVVLLSSEENRRFLRDAINAITPREKRGGGG